jgi:hypothetical protein
VKERLDLGFRPKDKEEGSIPLPDQFVARMKARRASCSRFGLHRFRKTFATMHHEGESPRGRFSVVCGTVHGALHSGIWREAMIKARRRAALVNSAFAGIEARSERRHRLRNHRHVLLIGKATGKPTIENY